MYSVNIHAANKNPLNSINIPELSSCSDSTISNGHFLSLLIIMIVTINQIYMGELCVFGIAALKSNKFRTLE